MDVLDQLRTLVAVVDQGGFTQAGRQLRRSKALVSKHVSDLENRLGARLLNRTTRQVSLTEVGAAFVERARNLIIEFDDLEEAVRNTTGTPRGRLRITAPQAFGELELMDLIREFRTSYPDIQPELFLADRSVDVVGEGFDVALRVTAMPDSALIVRKMCDVPIRICASPEYLAVNGTPASPSELVDHACIADSNMAAFDSWRMQLDEIGPPTQVKIGVAMQINNAAAIRQAARDGLGIIASPEFIVGQDLQSGQLVELFAGQARYDLALHLLYPHRQHLSAKARAFIDFTVAWYRAKRPWQL